MSTDPYALTRELIALLVQAGRPAEAQALRSAMDEGATGTEILMAVRLRLVEMLQRVPLTGAATH